MKTTHFLLVAILASALPTTLHAAEPPLNVLLITADDLGYEAMDFLDGKVVTVHGLTGIKPRGFPPFK